MDWVRLRPFAYIRAGDRVRRGTIIAVCTGAVVYSLTLVVGGRHIRQRVTDTRRAKALVPVAAFERTPAGEYLTFSDKSIAAHHGRLSIRAKTGGELLRLGPPIAAEAHLVRRMVEKGDSSRLRRDRAGRVSGQLGETPTDFGLPFTSVSINNRAAWLIPSPGPARSNVWVIHVHGLGGSRSQVLRGLPVFSSLGFTSLVPTYRTSLDAESEPARFSHLGMTEWQDIVSAHRYARDAGAERIIYVGWSLGASIVLRVLESGPVSHATGVLLISPALDWRQIILSGLSATGIPRVAAQWILSGFNLFRLPGEPRIRWKRMPGLSSDQERSEVPLMVFHGSADRSVPVQLSRDFVSNRAIPYLEFQGAHHTLEWNSAPEVWEAAVRDWCRCRLNLWV